MRNWVSIIRSGSNINWRNFDIVRDDTRGYAAEGFVMRSVAGLAFGKGANNARVVTMYGDVTVSVTHLEKPKNGEFEGNGFHPTYVPAIGLPPRF